MIKLEGIETFIASAEQGSLSEAARLLGLSRSVVSERLAELEKEMGARLIQRTTRRMTLTEDGQVFLARARRIAQEISHASDELAERHGQLVGSLRISAPVSFGYLHLGPALYPFLKMHPQIELALDLDDRFVDVEANGYDAVIRHGAIRNSLLVAIRVAPSRRMLVASPSYLDDNGIPATLHDLGQHRAIVYTNRTADWRFTAPQGAVTVHPKLALRVNNGLIMRDAALAGMGVALLPDFMIHTEVRKGLLRKIDVGVEPEHTEIHLAYPKAQPPSAKLRALIKHLKDCFGAPPYWDL